MLIVVHFAAILVAVTGADNLWLPERLRFIHLTASLRPYLQFVFMKNPYRFFAPNPTATVRLYFHVLGSKGATRWFELPRKEGFSSSFIYHRYCKMPQHAVRKMRYPMDRSRWVLNREGETIIASYVRQVVETSRAQTIESRVEGDVHVEVYQANHGLMPVEKARRGWEPTDLRLYDFEYLGHFTAEGRRIDTGPIHKVRRSEMFARVFHNDLLPRMTRHPGQDVVASERAVAEEIGVPEPLRGFIGKPAELLEFGPDEIAERARTTEKNADEPGAPYGADISDAIEGAARFPL